MNPVVDANGEEHPWWLAFRLADVSSSARFEALRSHFGSLERAWNASSPELRRVLGNRERMLSAITSSRQAIDPVNELERLQRDGVGLVTLADPGYPRLLREVPAPPPVLFVRGTLTEEDATSLAIVGTRKATGYGREMATAIAGDLAQAGVTIVSGLATGIDGVAHRAALEAGGRTIAVLGSGIHDIYPRNHARLAREIAESGAVISDILPHAKPDRWNFPARNRIISGLSLGVLVVEAPEKSGALITVDFAADQGREVFAVPGPANAHASAGCNRILRDGARLVRNASDLIEDLRLKAPANEPAVQQALLLDDDERRVLAVLTSEPMHIDDVGESAGLALPRVSAILLTLELQNLVRNAGAQHYTRR
ncbi:MAG TPA: DNA-processing protein DprA [Thermomicrobiales bacterium]|nr:DNA-processing protein DprA [Thermomicrobiales bacterium]